MKLEKGKKKDGHAAKETIRKNRKRRSARKLKGQNRILHRDDGG